jgi:PII-like signaling protein
MYLRQGDTSLPTTFWQRLFRKPLATYLVQEALRAGVTHSSVHLGHMGFAKGAKRVSADVTEIPVTTLPVCVELVGPKPLLEQFVRDQAKHLEGATLVMLEGVHILSHVVEDEVPTKPHHVEYVKAKGVTLPVDHVEVDSTGPEAPASFSIEEIGSPA